jgi:proline utilization trans-activator
MNEAKVHAYQSEGTASPGASPGAAARQKRNSLACIRCRTRHIRCPGGNPCKKCILAKTKCEYVEADKKIVVLMKYLLKLHDDIARLKKDNATLRNSVRGHVGPGGVGAGGAGGASAAAAAAAAATAADADFGRFNSSFALDRGDPAAATTATAAAAAVPAISGGGGGGSGGGGGAAAPAAEVIHPSLDRGRLIQLRTGEKLYVGSSLMTLFGLEIQNMVPLAPRLLGSPPEAPEAAAPKRGTRILESEGNAYNITLAKTSTRPGVSLNVTLPPYLYAMRLVDTFVNYNDGCFYFFNEGLVKRFLLNLYSGKLADNRQILRRNTAPSRGPALDENAIKQDTDDDAILETIWFCKVLLIFATGEMYLGTESDPHRRGKRGGGGGGGGGGAAAPAATLPGAAFFYQASDLFTGLFASGAIDNTVKDGGIEAMLLYAFFLQVADCTIASYFYFGLALRLTLILGWHVDAGADTLDRFEREHRRRVWWTVYMYERMLLLKAGLPLSFADASVLTALPRDVDMRVADFPRDPADVRGYYVFPPAEYINNCVVITQINAMVLLLLYTKQPTINILPVVLDLVHKLMRWKSALPEFLRVDFAAPPPLRVLRLVVNLMTEYFQGLNLAVRPLLFHFATKLRELHRHRYVDLTKYSKNVLTLLNASFQASVNSIRCIWALVPDNMVALFGWMDREYLFTLASTLILFNATFGVHEATAEHLDHALMIFAKMERLGNYPAALRRSQLLRLIRVLDFNGVMGELLQRHEGPEPPEAAAEPKTEPPQTEPLTTEPPEAEAEPGRPLPYGAPAASVAPRASQPPETAFSPPLGTQPLGSAPAAPHASAPWPAALTLAGLALPLPADFYLNLDLAGIEGLTYHNDEQQLWNDITNDAVWLNMSDDRDFGEVIHTFAPDHGGYGDIVNHEFESL